jgi:release factor glutamine methyltransferase
MNLSIRAAISEGAQLLKSAGVREAQHEARLLLMHSLGCDRTFVITHSEDEVPPAPMDHFRRLVNRRASGEPAQYLTGRQEFFKLDFAVSPAVLIPRPETELLVETALDLLRDYASPRLADVGTGSGCIAISLLHELPAAQAIATDVSPAALAIARRNAERHRVIDRLQLIESDLLSGVDQKSSFDVIVSNPPYVSEAGMSNLQREVRREPARALAAGPDGLAVIKRLLGESAPYLQDDGHLLFEIGFGQSENVKDLIRETAWELVSILCDLQGIPRTVVIRKRRD